MMNLYIYTYIYACKRPRLLWHSKCGTFCSSKAARITRGSCWVEMPMNHDRQVSRTRTGTTSIRNGNATLPWPRDKSFQTPCKRSHTTKHGFKWLLENKRVRTVLDFHKLEKAATTTTTSTTTCLQKDPQEHE